VNSLAISITAVTVQQVLGLQWTVGDIGAGGMAPRKHGDTPKNTPKAVSLEKQGARESSARIGANRRRSDKSNRDPEFALEMANERSIAHAQAAQ
jgi:hypothetical protein